MQCPMATSATTKIGASIAGAILSINALNSREIYSGERVSPVWGPLYCTGGKKPKGYSLHGAGVISGVALGASSGTLSGF